MSKHARVGDVVRFTVFKWSPSDTNLAEKEPFLGVIVSGDRRNGDAVMFLPAELAAEYDDDPTPTWAFADWDEFEIVPPDQWPDKVCQVVALFKLTGETATD